MFPPPFRRHAADGPLDKFEQGLLHALPRHVPCQGGALRLAGDLIDLIKIDNAGLGPLHIVATVLQQLQDNVLNILADIAGFGQRRRIGNGEGNVERPGQGLRQQCLAGPGRADHQNVPLLQLDVLKPAPVQDALVVVVHRDRENFLGPVLADDIVIESRPDLGRFGHGHV